MLKALLLLAMVATGLAQSSSEGKFKLLGEWNALKFATPSSSSWSTATTTTECDSCMLAGVKVSKTGRFFVSVPRWKTGVPATMSEINLTTGLLTPFPSAELNRIGAAGALQSVLGFEIDAQDRVWMLDQGKVAGAAALPGAIKLLVWDLKKNEQVLLHEFDPAVASPTASFLNDLVVDQVNNFAYITDSGITTNASAPLQPALIVFDSNTNSARRVLDRDVSVMNTDLWLVVNGSKVGPTSPMRTGADGIALSPDTKRLYFCPLTGHTLYEIPTLLLRNADVRPLVLSKAVRNVTSKAASDGLAMANNDMLFLTALELNGIYQLNTSSEHAHAPYRPLATDPHMVWSDTIGFDHKGNIVWVTNDLPAYWEGKMNFKNPPSPNFHIWSSFVDADSYLFPRKGSKDI